MTDIEIPPAGSEVIVMDDIIFVYVWFILITIQGLMGIIFSFILKKESRSHVENSSISQPSRPNGGDLY